MGRPSISSRTSPARNWAASAGLPGLHGIHCDTGGLEPGLQVVREVAHLQPSQYLGACAGGVEASRSIPRGDLDAAPTLRLQRNSSISRVRPGSAPADITWNCWMSVTGCWSKLMITSPGLTPAASPGPLALLIDQRALTVAQVQAPPCILSSMVCVSIPR